MHASYWQIYANQCGAFAAGVATRSAVASSDAGDRHGADAGHAIGTRWLKPSQWPCGEPSCQPSSCNWLSCVTSRAFSSCRSTGFATRQLSKRQEPTE